MPARLAWGLVLATVVPDRCGRLDRHGTLGANHLITRVDVDEERKGSRKLAAMGCERDLYGLVAVVGENPLPLGQGAGEFLRTTTHLAGQRDKRAEGRHR